MKATHYRSSIDKHVSLILDHIYVDLEEHSEDSFLLDIVKTMLLEKRIPIHGLMPLLVHKSYGGDIKDILPIASSIELLKAAIAIHYSSQPVSDGLETNAALGILSGNLLIAHSINALRSTMTREILTRLSNAMIELIDAYVQLVSISSNGGFIPDVGTYSRINRKLSTDYLRESVDMICSLNEISGFQHSIIMKMTDYIGLAWQLKQDYSAALEVLRRDIELPRALMNYPMIYAIEKSSIKPMRMPSSEIIITLLYETDALEHTRHYASSIVMQAELLCQRLPINKTEEFYDLFEMITI